MRHQTKFLFKMSQQKVVHKLLREGKERQQTWMACCFGNSYK